MSRDSISGMGAEVIDGSNLMHLRGWFAGPPDTPYAGGTFSVDIQLPGQYPFVPPKMKFETRVWHPNVSSQTVWFSGLCSFRFHPSPPFSPSLPSPSFYSPSLLPSFYSPSLPPSSPFLPWLMQW